MENARVEYIAVDEYSLGRKDEWYVIYTIPGLSEVEADRYLHADGQWRLSTRNNGQWTGYFETKELAEAALAAVSPPES
jgi:hypothetical protein